MIWVCLIALAAIAALGVFINAQIRYQRAADREFRRRESELLDRLMFLAGRPWNEPQGVSPSVQEPPLEESIIWPEAITLEVE